MKIFLSLCTVASLLLAPSLEAASTCSPSCYSFDCSSYSGWYVSALGGFDRHYCRPSSHGIHRGLNGYAAGGALGYRFGNGLRLEAEATYRQNSFHRDHQKSCSFSRSSEGSCSLDERECDTGCHRSNRFSGDRDQNRASSSARTTSAMVNGYWDFACEGFTPYVGGGLGYAHDHGDRIERNWSNFAQQLMAGVRVPVSESLELGVEYRYLHRQNRSYSHGALAKLTHNF